MQRFFAGTAAVSAASGTFRPTWFFSPASWRCPVIDVERLVLPKKIVYPLTVLVAALLCWRLLRPASGTPTWSERSARSAWFVVFFAMNLPSVRGSSASVTCGFRWSSAWLWAGWGVGYVILGFFAANLIGAVVGIALIATKRMSRRAGSPTACSWPSGVPLRCSPVPSSFVPSRTTRSETTGAGLIAVSERSPSAGPVRPIRDPRDADPGFGEDPARGPQEGGGVEQMGRDAPGTSASRIRRRPGTSPPGGHVAPRVPFSECLDHCMGTSRSAGRS